MKLVKMSEPVSVGSKFAASFAIVMLSACGSGSDNTPPDPVIEDEIAVIEDEPPVIVDEPPVIVDEPPIIVDEPPIIVDEPPIIVDEPPVIVDEPPAIEEVPPVIVSDGSGSIQNLGTLSLVHSTSPDETDTFAQARFVELDTPVSISMIDLEQVFADVGQCRQVGADGSLPGGLEGSDLDDFLITDNDTISEIPISAGEVITLTDLNVGTYASLMLAQLDADFPYAQSDIGMSPDGITLQLDIPGATFPAVTELSLPTFEHFTEDFTQQISNLSTNLELQWTAPTLPGGAILSSSTLVLTAFEADLTNFSLNGFICVMQDIGNFTFPADLATALGDNFTPTAISTVRTAFHLYDVGNESAILYAQTSGNSRL